MGLSAPVSDIIK